MRLFTLIILFLISIVSHGEATTGCEQWLRPSQESHESLLEVDRLGKEVFKQYFEDHGHYYIEAKNKGHRFALFLEELGFIFSGTEGISHPPFSILIKRLEQRVQDLIDSGLITEEEAIWPHVKLSSIINSENLLLNEIEFAGALAQGSFPVSGFSGVNGGSLAMLHDLAHFSAMVQNPEYMRALRKSYNALLPELQKGEPSEAVNIKHRIFIALETLVILNPDKQNDLFQLLKLDRFLSGNQRSFKADILNFYNTLTEEEINNIIKALNNNVDYFIKLGGASLDLHAMSEQLLIAQSPFETLYGRLFVSQMPNRDNLASFAKFVLNISTLSIEDWVEQLISLEDITRPELLEFQYNRGVYSASKGDRHLLNIFSNK